MLECFDEIGNHPFIIHFGPFTNVMVFGLTVNQPLAQVLANVVVEGFIFHHDCRFDHRCVNTPPLQGIGDVLQMGHCVQEGDDVPGLGHASANAVEKVLRPRTVLPAKMGHDGVEVRGSDTNTDGTLVECGGGLMDELRFIRRRELEGPTILLENQSRRRRPIGLTNLAVLDNVSDEFNEVVEMRARGGTDHEWKIKD